MKNNLVGPRVGSDSPFGEIVSVQQAGRGIWRVEVDAGHGLVECYRYTAKANQEVPVELRKTSGWYKADELFEQSGADC